VLDVNDNLNIYIVASNQHDLHHAVQVSHNNRLMDNQFGLENEDSFCEDKKKGLSEPDDFFSEFGM